ncbi:MAG: protease inhibitor I9 family protein, partial [Nitrosopumilaceae archaeon]
MKITGLLGVSLIFSMLILSSSLPYSASAQNFPEFEPGRYIVVLEEGDSTQDITRGHGVIPEFVYNHALNGFAGYFSPVSLEKFDKDPRVKYIEKDQKVYITSNDIPTGIERT